MSENIVGPMPQKRRAGRPKGSGRHYHVRASKVHLGLLSKEELCVEMGVSVRTVDHWIRRKLIPYIKINGVQVYFRIADIKKALEHFEVKEVDCDK